MYKLIFYALCITLILFGFYHYINIKKEFDENPYKKYDLLADLFSVNNIVIFTIIYAVSFTLIYFSFDDKVDILSMIGETDNEYSKLNNIAKTTLIDPNILKNITEPMSSGFEPYNSSGGSICESSDDSSSLSSNDSD
jgi:hypothetical protein